jgi:hypothetical protein
MIYKKVIQHVHPIGRWPPNCDYKKANSNAASQDQDPIGVSANISMELFPWKKGISFSQNRNRKAH